MKSVNAIFFIFLITLGLISFAAIGQETNLRELQARIRERLPRINELKQAEMVGENNQGYLTVRKKPAREEQAQEVKKLVEQENNDRKKVYTMIGIQHNAPLELVGRRRARQIFKAAIPGVWVQTQEGEWIKKTERN